MGENSNKYSSQTKSPFVTFIVLLVLITIPLFLLAVSQNQDNRQRASEVSGFNKGLKYEIVSDLPDQYPIKVTRNIFDEYLTQAGIFDTSGVFDFNTGNNAIIDKVVIHLTKDPQPMNKLTGAIGEGNNNIVLLESAGVLILDQTLNIYIYLSPEVLSQEESFRSLSFNEELIEAISELKLSPKTRDIVVLNRNQVSPQTISYFIEQKGVTPVFTVQILKTNN